MEEPISRQEFIKKLAPSRETGLVLARLMKWLSIAFIGIFVVNLTFNISISLEGWLLLGGFILTLCLLALLLQAYKLFLKKLEEQKKSNLLALMRSLEKVLAASIYMSIGISLYQKWQNSPESAYVLTGIILFITFRNEFMKRTAPQDKSE